MSAPPGLRRVVAFVRREVGAVAALLGLAVLLNGFIFIADEVVEGETSHFDRAVLTALRVPGRPHQPIGPPWLDMAAAAMTTARGLMAAARPCWVHQLPF